MDTKLIKLHKGVDNSVQFKVKDKDYKAVAVDHMTVGARLVNQETDEVMVEKYLDGGICKGQMCLTVYEGDLMNVPAGFYTLILTQEKAIYSGNATEAAHLPFYTDQGDNISYKVEVTNQGKATPKASIELTPNEWVPHDASSDPYTVYSPAVPANSIRNHKNSLHTFTIEGDSFTGSLYAYGTLEANPPTEITSYFDIDITDGVQEIVMDDYTGLSAFTLTANLTWVKFKLVYDPDIELEDNGSVKSIIWRS
jgi:hypothetical protein